MGLKLVMRMSVRFMTFDRAGAGFRYRSTQSCVAAQVALEIAILSCFCAA